MDLRAGGNAVDKDHAHVVLGGVRREDHALALHAAERGGLEVRDDDDAAADEVLGLIPFRDAGGDGARRAGAVVQRELQKLLGALDRLAGRDLGNRQLDLCEIVDRDLRDAGNGFLLRCFRRRGLRRVFRLDFGDLRLHLLHVDAREEDLGLFGHLIAVRVEAEGLERFVCARRSAELRKDPFGRFGHEGDQERRADADAFHKIVQHGGKPVGLRLVLCERPRHGFVDVFVAALEQREDFGDRIGHAQLVHLGLHAGLGAGRDGLEVRVDVLDGALVGDNAAEILVAHRDRAVHEVAERVREVGIRALDQQVPRDGAVGFKRHLVQDEIAHGVDAEQLDEVLGVEHVALRLAHLAAVHQEPRVAEHLLRQRQAERHQEDRPVDRVEADDVLADQVQVGRPVALELLGALAVAVVADAGDVVRQRVKPDVDDVLVVEVDRDAPLERRSRDAEVLQAGQQEVVHHLVLALHGLDEFRVRVDVLDQAVGILAHLEEVRLLLRRLHLAAAVGALAVDELGLGEERLARRAVHALVVALVDVALLVELFEDLLDLLFVVVVGRADELVVRGVHDVPVRADDLRDLVDVFLRRDAGGLRLFLDLLAVLVGAGLEEHVVALEALEARDAVGEHDLIRVADVRAARGVGDRRRDIVLRFAHGFHHSFCLLFLYPVQVNRTAESADRSIRPASASAPIRMMSFLFLSVYILRLPSGIVFHIISYSTILFFACKLRIDFILRRGYNYFKCRPARRGVFSPAGLRESVQEGRARPSGAAIPLPDGWKARS